MKRPRVLVTRAAEDAEPWVMALAEAGYDPVVLPLLSFETCGDPAAVRQALKGAGRGWVAITSPRAVAALKEAGPLPSGLKVAAVGAMTALRLRAAGFSVDLTSEADGAAGLVRAFAALEEPPPDEARVLWLTGNLSAADFAFGLKALGYDVIRIEVYRTVNRRPAPSERAAALADLAAVSFGSPSAVEAFVSVAGAEWMNSHAAQIIAVAVGGTTERALARAGFKRRTEADEPCPDGLARAVGLALKEDRS
jgi:uroporphyrinogen-III synthase